ncbi:MAG: serine protease [Sphingomonadales bacterium]|nr:serine protease [Sphingomonadales bacterium]
MIIEETTEQDVPADDGLSIDPDSAPDSADAVNPAPAGVLPQAGRDAEAPLQRTGLGKDGKYPHRRCGTRTCVRVVGTGSHPASQAESPWQVSLWSFKYTDYSAEEYRVKPEWLRRHKCGGTLIAAEWILTAAHCISGDLADHPYKARVGSALLTDQRGTFFDVVEKIPHESYVAALNRHDIALLRVKPVHLPGVRPIRLLGMADDGNLPPETPARVYGFGKTRAADASALLIRGDVAIWAKDSCNAAYRERAAAMTSLVFCANAGDTDSCQGDSGGPLVVGEGPDAVEAGVVSWGRGCGVPGSPGVYTNVAKYLPWIWNHTHGAAGKPISPLQAR